ncbi:FAD-dependent oxidoreductase [Rhodococcus sp. NPDC049939]|uniref:FAD-dependent oxidoreductase n=1 Tax=Rhodococcus sp. NPDC049939 TaxID=3155511 RepID=UPI0034006498
MADILIVGAGPAGLAAAVAARRRAATVRIIDAAEGLGGQYWRHLPSSRPSAREGILHHGWDTFRTLHDAVCEDPGIVVSMQTEVWAIERTADNRLRVNLAQGEADGFGRQTEALVPEQLILATGAHDRALPVPGWTLPGVFTAGAAQAMAKGERVSIGGRVVVAGSGPFLLPVTASLGQAGARVVGVYEASRSRALARHWLARPWELVGAARKIGELAEYAAHHIRGRVPYRTGHGVVAVHGTDRVEAVTVAALDEHWRAVAGTERRIDCDAVCFGHGFVPRLELPIAAGCRITERRFVHVDASQRTSADRVFAVGELTTIGGVDLALAQGEIAGWVAAGGSLDDRDITRAIRSRARAEQFAERIARAHVIGDGWPDWLHDDTVVCRCEDVDAGTLTRVAAATNSAGLRPLKLNTRAGLGLCQGRICGRSVEQILLATRGCDGFADGATTDRRPIATPIRIADLARAPRSPS